MICACTRRRQKHRSNLILGINNAHNAFHLSGAMAKIRMGYETQIYVRPVQVCSDEDVRDLDISVRKCRFLDEVPKESMFNFYTQDLCLYQCVLEKSAEVCQCIPWGYPRRDSNNNATRLCDSFGAACFEDRLKHFMGDDEACSCLPDCASVDFPFTKRETPLDTEEECNHETR